MNDPDGFVYVYVRCDCHVWQVAAGYRYGRCGRCGVSPHTAATRAEWEARTPFDETVPT